MLVYVSHPNTGEEDKKIVEDFIKENLKKYKDITFISLRSQKERGNSVGQNK